MGDFKGDMFLFVRLFCRRFDLSSRLYCVWMHGVFAVSQPVCPISRSTLAYGR